LNNPVFTGTVSNDRNDVKFLWNKHTNVLFLDMTTVSFPEFKTSFQVNQNVYYKNLYSYTGATLAIDLQSAKNVLAKNTDFTGNLTGTGGSSTVSTNTVTATNATVTNFTCPVSGTNRTITHHQATATATATSGSFTIVLPVFNADCPRVMSFHLAERTFGAPNYFTNSTITGYYQSQNDGFCEVYYANVTIGSVIYANFTCYV
jgi:hypothetical protein